MKTQKSQAAQEAYVPTVMEDLEVGDRIFRYDGLNKGSLGRVESLHEGFVLVEMDSGEFEGAPIGLFDQDSPYWKWDKLINLDEVEVGSRLSRTEWGTRMFAIVESYTPGEEMVVRYDFKPAAGKAPTRTVFKKPAPETGSTFEHLFLGWQLEG